MSRMRNSVGTFRMRGLMELMQLYTSKTSNAMMKNVVFGTTRPRIADNGVCNLQFSERFVLEDHARTAATSCQM